MKKMMIFFFCMGISTSLRSAITIEKIVRSLVIVQLEVDGVGGLFLLDTGSNANMIDPSFVKKLEQSSWLERNESIDTLVSTFNGKVKSKGYNLTLNIDGKKYLKMKTYEVSSQKFDVKRDGISCCDGILGMPFFKEARVLIDSKKKLVFLGKEAQLNGSPIKIDLIGNDIISLNCHSEQGGALKARLDTGSEAPVILQPTSIEKFLVKERLKLKNLPAKGALWIEGLGVWDCGGAKFKSNPFAYLSQFGALGHRFVDLNLGAAFLGEKYLIDIENRKITIEKSGVKDLILKQFKTTSFNFKQDVAKKRKTQILIADVLMSKGCLESSSPNDCGRDRDKILGKDYQEQIKLKTTLENAAAMVGGMGRYECTHSERVRAIQSFGMAHHFCWWDLLSYPNYPNKKVKDGVLNFVPKFKLDNQISYHHYADPFEFTKDFYCLARKEGIFSYEGLPFEMFAFSVEGISLSTKNTKGLDKWFQSPDGKKCKEMVEQSLGVSPRRSDFDLFAGKKFLIATFPLTILSSGSGQLFKTNFSRVLNHERLHIFYADNKKARDWAQKQWNSLSQNEKEVFKKAHPSYDFSNETIIYREYFSYYFEKKQSEELAPFF